MIIYLDESKKLGEGKIIFGGFITKHNNAYIEKIVQKKKIKLGLNKEFELKGVFPKGKMFFEKILSDNTFDILEKSIIGINIEGYYKDNLEQYSQIINLIIARIYKTIQYCNDEILIIADKVVLGKVRDTEKYIEENINKEFLFNKRVKFIFGNSKTYSGIQISDLISHKLRTTIYNNEKLEDYIGLNSYNMDLEEIFYI